MYLLCFSQVIKSASKIISKAQLKSSVTKLKTAGADHVILPEMLGGTHMATLISKPDVIEFINNLWGDGAESVNIESVAYEVLPDSLKDKSVHDIISMHKTGVNCLGIKNEKGKFIINPPAETIIKPQMKIILFGTIAQITKMKLRLME